MNKTLRLAQISDLHYCREPGGLLDSPVVTDHTLKRVLDRLALWAPDWVIATGDLAQDPEPVTYLRLRKTFAHYPFRVYPLPGNHDDPLLMARMLGFGDGEPVKHLVAGAWQLLLLDSTLPGHQQGRLAPEELSWLDETLAANPGRHALVCLHHHPLPVSSPWMDRIALTNAAELLDCLAGHGQVRGVVFGHVHQAFEAEWRGIRFFGTPATCVQFRPNSSDLIIDETPPAFRRFELHPGGRLESFVEYLAEPDREGKRWVRLCPGQQSG